MPAVHGLAGRQGETAFAFLVLRMVAPVSRPQLLAVVHHVAPLIAEVERFVESLPEELDEPIQLVTMPWAPPEAGHAVEVQRRLIDGAAIVGVDAAWFFQCGTRLVGADDAEEEEAAEESDGDDDDDDDEAEDTETPGRAETTDDTWLHPGEEDDIGSRPVLDPEGTNAGGRKPTRDGRGADHDDDDDDEDDADDDEPRDDEDDGSDAAAAAAAAAAADEDSNAEQVHWSHHGPPLATTLRVPVDHYPAIIDELDWEDFGIAVKLAGPRLAGEAGVLRGFHALWLAPYGRRYRNADVTYDGRRHAAHLWVDRFAVMTPNAEQVHHLLWVIDQLDTVIPLVHARFAGATMAQKYAGALDRASEPFVLGGNPLIAAHRDGGEAAVDAVLARPGDWTGLELAAMLRELAIEIVTEGGGGHADGGEAREEGDDEDEEDDEDEDDEEDDDGDEGTGAVVDAVFDNRPRVTAAATTASPGLPGRAAPPEAVRRSIAELAVPVLVARAKLGKLDARSIAGLHEVAGRAAGDPTRAAALAVLGAVPVDRAGLEAVMAAASAVLAALDADDGYDEELEALLHDDAADDDEDDDDDNDEEDDDDDDEDQDDADAPDDDSADIN